VEQLVEGAGAALSAAGDLDLEVEPARNCAVSRGFARPAAAPADPWCPL
jgi:hypothetical protein